jgi:hypothetical protein
MIVAAEGTARTMECTSSPKSKEDWYLNSRLSCALTESVSPSALMKWKAKWLLTACKEPYTSSRKMR